MCVCLYLWMFVYICMCSYMYVCMFAYSWMRVCLICMCILYGWMFVVHMYVYMYVCMFLCIYLHVCVYVCMYLCVFICVVYVYIYVCGVWAAPFPCWLSSLSQSSVLSALVPQLTVLNSAWWEGLFVYPQKTLLSGIGWLLGVPPRRYPYQKQNTSMVLSIPCF